MNWTAEQIRATVTLLAMLVIVCAGTAYQAYQQASRPSDVIVVNIEQRP